VRTFADISFSTFRIGELFLTASLPLIFLSLKKGCSERQGDGLENYFTWHYEECCEQKTGVSHD
jgi:hypothetical protein